MKYHPNLYKRIQPLQVAKNIPSPLVLNDRLMRSALDSSITPWQILPIKTLSAQQFQCKKEFLFIYKIITHALGSPTSLCILANTIIGITTWESIPIERQYLALEQSAGVFEASSMTYLQIKGPDAKHLLNQLTPRNIERFKPGQAKFVIFTTPMGTVDDDGMILKISEDEFLLSCGGSKAPEKTLSFLPQVLKKFSNVTISSPDIISFNIKGPKRIEAMKHLIIDSDQFKISSLLEFQFCQATLLNGDDVWIVKTKIGIEMWGKVQTIGWAWQYILSHPEIYTPCGWNILHTFRMENEELFLSVYPFDIHDATLLWEIGCGWMINEKESDYIGRQALVHGKNKKIFELKKIKALASTTKTAKVGAVLHKDNGDFAGYITSSAFSIKSQCAVAFAHLLIDNNHDATFYIQSKKDKWIVV